MTEPTELPVPAKILTVGERQLVMSYAMLMEVCRILPDPASSMQLLMSDNFTQDWVVRRLLTPVTKPIETTADLIPAHEIELDSNEVEQILSWAMEHVLYFFAKRTRGLQRVGLRFQQALPLPNPSSTGSQNSPSTEPSAGPSTASSPSATISDGD